MKKSMPNLPTHSKSKNSMPKASKMSMPKSASKMSMPKAKAMKSKKGC